MAFSTYDSVTATIVRVHENTHPIIASNPVRKSTSNEMPPQL